MSKSSPEREYARSEFDREVSALLEEILSVPPAERQFVLAGKLREMRTKKGTEFGDRLEVLRAAVKRGKLLIELRAANEILEKEALRAKGKRPV